MSDAKSPPELSMDEILASIRRIIAEDERTHPAVVHDRLGDGPRLAVVGDADDDDEVLELTEAVNDDGSIRHLRVVAPLPAEKVAVNAPGEAIGFVAPAAGNAQPKEPEVPLVSTEASHAASVAFEELGTMPREPRLEPAPPLDERNLDQAMREELRPLLRAWLDDNLPAIVERLVKAEISRIAGR